MYIYIYMPGKNEFQRYRGYDTDCCSVYRNTVPLKTRFCKIMFSHKIEHACINHSRTRVSIMHASKRAGPRRRTLSVTPPRPCAPAPPRPRAPAPPISTLSATSEWRRMTRKQPGRQSHQHWDWGCGGIPETHGGGNMGCQSFRTWCDGKTSRGPGVKLWWRDLGSGRWTSRREDNGERGWGQPQVW